MWAVPEHFRVRIGGNIYIDTRVLIEAHGVPLITLKRHDDNGYLGIYFDIYDASGEKLASVKRNEIYPAKRTADSYRVDGSADRVSFIEKATSRVLCDIKKRDAAGENELDVSVRLYTSKGVLIDATPGGTNLGGAHVIGCVIRNCNVGIAID
jgi:hypothetical protein